MSVLQVSPQKGYSAWQGTLLLAMELAESLKELTPLYFSLKVVSQFVGDLFESNGYVEENYRVVSVTTVTQSFTNKTVN